MLTRLAELSNGLAHRSVIDCAWLGVLMDVAPNTGDRLCFGQFEADLAARTLYRRGFLIHIQDKPFQILALLLAKPGEVVTREELQKALWPRDTFVDFDEVSTLLSGNCVTRSVTLVTILSSSKRFLARVIVC